LLDAAKASHKDGNFIQHYDKYKPIKSKFVVEESALGVVFELLSRDIVRGLRAYCSG
jgi:hypothetical protein